MAAPTIPIFSLVNLALTIKDHYTDLKTNSKRTQRLNARVGVLKDVLEDVQELRDENDVQLAEEPRIQGALQGVQIELDRAHVLFKELKQEGVILALLRAPATRDKLQDIENCLDHAINVLELVLNSYHHQNSREFQRRMEAWMVTLSKFMERLEDESEHQIDSDKEHFRYNEKMMVFLQNQLGIMEDVLSKQKHKQLLQKKQGSENLREQEEKRNEVETWEVTEHELENARKLGHLLISRHRKPFDLTKFYRTSDAKKAVEMICGTLQRFSAERNLPSAKIQTRVPIRHVVEDKTRLLQYLSYALFDSDCDFKNKSQKEEWVWINGKVKGLLDVLPLAGDLHLRYQIAGKVYQGTWKEGQAVAVKRPANEDDPARLDLEDFAEFFTTMVALLRTRSQHVVDIVGVTDTGMILMELGHFDLSVWLERHQQEGLAAKLGLLLQGAKGLQHVHQRGLVHRDVCTRKFVIFGDEATPTVKIAGLGLAVVRHEDGASVTLRSHIDREKNTAWVAPEIFEGKAHTTASDIYSFGIVLYHV
eukprot:evm.model.scf_1406EXC.2 EVM.evm.TU.scf_1406EXC.2   scf_1406EXC:38948-42255(+)